MLYYRFKFARCETAGKPCCHFWGHDKGTMCESRTQLCRQCAGRWSKVPKRRHEMHLDYSFRKARVRHLWYVFVPQHLLNN